MMNHGIHLKNRGYILLPVMVMILVIVTVGIINSQQSGIDLRQTNDAIYQQQAQYVAEAGLQHALHQIDTTGCAIYSDIPPQDFGPDKYSVNQSTNIIGGTITVYQIPIKQDSYIVSNNSSTNYGSATELETFFNLLPFSIVRSLFQFDFSASGIPAGSQILSAVAKIRVVDPNTSAAVTVHRITSAWDEGTVNWDNIEAEHDTNAITSIARNPATDQYTDVNITSLAQGWVNGSIENHGIMLKTTFIGDRARYASKEYGDASFRPYLEIRVLSGTVADEINVTSTATMASGLQRSITRESIPIYQSVDRVIEIQAVEKVKDTFIEGEGGHHDHNKGTDKDIKVNTYAKPYSGLLEFDLAEVPYGAKIKSAELQLELDSSAGSINTIDIHRVNASWTENEVTWLSRNGTDAWNTAGGDYSSAIFGQLDTTSLGPVTASITKLVQSWVDGSAENYGMILVMDTNGGNEKKFISSDDNGDPNLHPKLTVTYTCPCGIVCTAPQGNGKVLLVVGNSANPSVNDQLKHDLFESWGYEVNFIDDEDNQSSFDSELNNHDIAYVSESSDSTQLGNKLTDTNKGVLNEEAQLNDELGIASGGSQTTVDSIEFIDVSHPITSIFPLGIQKIYSQSMSGLTATGAIAAGANRLGDLSAAPGLLAMDSGSNRQGGGTFNGRRVMLPIGKDTEFVWPLLNNNGRLLIQRSIDWAAGNECNTQEYSVRVAHSRDDAEEYSNGVMSLTSTDLDMSYDDEAPAGDRIVGLRFSDIPFDKNFVITSAYLDFTAAAVSTVGTSLTIYGEDDDNAPSYGTNNNDISNRTKTSNHSDWKNLPNWEAIGNVYTSPNLAPIVQEIFDRNNWVNGNALSFIIDGSGTRNARSYDGSAAQAPVLRIQYCGVPIPEPTPLAHWKLDETSETTATDSVNNFDGTLEFGPTWNSNGAIDGALLFDGLDDQVVVNNEKDLSPADELTITAWVNNQDTTLSGQYAIINKSMPFFATSYTLQMVNNQVQAAIGGDIFTTSDTLSNNQWHHLALSFHNSRDEVRIYIDGNLSLVQSTTALITEVPTDLLIGNDWIGFSAWNGLLDDIRLYDQVLNEFEVRSLYDSGSPGGGALKNDPASACDGHYLDQFNNDAYTGDDGSLSWSGAWVENGESDGPTSGDIRVRSDVSNYQLRTRDNNNGGEGVEREFDLSSAKTATLSYDYRREDLDNSNDYTRVEISSNGATGPWTELGRHAGPNNDSNYQSQSFDISSYASPNTRIRFMTSPNMGNTDTVWFDNIRIDCSP